MKFRFEDLKTDKRVYQIAKYAMFGLILLVIISKIANLKFPGTTQDEFGYLYFPARVMGWDWSGVIKYHPFYGVGTGILWIPLFMIFSGVPTLLYQMIILLNALFLGGTFLISVYCAKHLFPDWGKWSLLVSCFAISFYPCYFFYAQVAISETLLYLLFWLVILLLIKIEKRPKYIYIISLAFISGYMVLVHLRTIVVVGVITLFMIYLKTLKKINWKQLMIFLVFIMMSGIIWVIFKNFYYSGLGEVNDINTTNTSFPVTGMMLYILNNLKLFIERLLTRVYYFLMTGGICLFGGAFFCVKKSAISIYSFIHKEEKKENSIYIFLTAILIINFLAFAVQGLGSTGRMDVVVYGRYMENLMGPFLLIGFYFLTTYKMWIKNISIYLGLIMCITPLVIYQMESAENKVFAIDSAVGMGAYFEVDMSEYSMYFSLLKAVCTIVFTTLCYVYMRGIVEWKKKALFKYLSFLMVGLTMAIWVYLGVESGGKFSASRTELYKSYSKVASVVLEEEKDRIVYIRDGDSCTDAKYLQFLLPDMSIDVQDKETFEKQGVSENTLYFSRLGVIDLEKLDDEISTKISLEGIELFDKE